MNTTNRVVSREKNDCTVVAYANAYGVAYEVAYAKMTEAGREPGRMFDFRKVGMTDISRDVSSYNLEETLKNIPTGRYIVGVPNHIFAVVDGKVLDYKAGLRRHVREIYEVAPSENVASV